MPVTALLRGLLPLLLVLAAAAARAADVPPHHRPDGTFQNNHLNFAPKGLLALLQWRLDAWRDGLPRPPQTATPQVAPDLAFLRANAGASMQPSVTWIGHATTLLQLGGLNILTDPIFSERASPVGFVGPRRAQPPGVALADLPHIDAVVVSHNHYDHLDAPSIEALARQPGGPPLFLVPLGNKAWMESLGVAGAVELDWWQSHRLGAVEFVLTPVQHWSGRGLADRMRTLWGGWALFAPDQQVFFTGDTGYSADFADIRARFAPRQGAQGFDLALIALGAYEPRWFMAEQHVDPAEAVKIHRDLLARRSIGVHWGTFALTDESLDAPPRALAEARRAQGVPDDDFGVLAIGETRRLTPRPAP